MEYELKQHLEGMEGRINSRADTMEERIKSWADARIEKTETALLSAFHGWARSMEIRVRGVSSVTFGFDERLAHAEERISELERKKAS